MPQIVRNKKIIVSVLIVWFLFIIGGFYIYSHKEVVRADSSDCVSTSSVTCTQAISSDGAYKINTYTLISSATGTTTWTPPAGVNSVQYLVVGGGGGGGGSSTSYAGGAGGGGGGGVVTGSLSSVSGTLNIQVGGGGGCGAAGVNDGSNGSNSFFSTITAYGGGGGAGGISRAGKSGASGGGASYGSSTGGSATQGYAGAVGGTQASAGTGGGGGGASKVASAPGTGCGFGGTGLFSTISDSLVYYGNGGGGGVVSGTCLGSGYHRYDTEAFSGSGGGGRVGSVAGTIPMPNTGSGGGGANSTTTNAGYDGSAGIVIVKYLIPSTADCVSSSGVACVQTITPDGQYKINKYILTGSSTASTTWTPPAGVTSVQYLVVGGGGAGGSVTAGGGGGGGGVLSGTSTVSSALTIAVGVGATADVASGGLGCRNTRASGGNSGISGTGFTTVTATGGGSGAGCSDAGSGGSGGGGSANSEIITNAGSGNTPSTSPAQGYSGGTALPQNGGSYSAGGGGGGAGGAGSNASIISTYYSSGNGGIGKLSTITGESVYYGGGGGGTCHYQSCDYGNPGAGGGGYGSEYHIMGSKGIEIGIVNGVDGFGGGGGGGSYYYDPGKGGSGTVIIKYLNTGCGTANGQAFSSAPSTNLCNSGTASSLSGTGPWTWTCTGTYGTASCSANKVGGSWLTDWNYRKKITINTGTGVKSLDNYQVKLTVAYASGMQNDFDDLRFATSNGLTPIDYWIESKTDGSSATVWVEVPLVFIGDTNIYMYYGKSSAVSASNGENTFAFFDDFNNLNKWITVGTNNYSIYSPSSGSDCTFTHSVSSGVYYSANNYGTGWTVYSVTLNPIPITNDFIVGTKFKMMPSCGGVNQYRASVRAKGQSGISNDMDDSATTRPEYFYRNNSIQVLYRDSANTYNLLRTNAAINESPNKKVYSILTTSMADDTYYKEEISYYGANDATSKIYSLSGTLMGTNSAKILSEGNYIILGDNHTYQTQDWLYVRKYTSVEPTSSFGSVEDRYISNECSSPTDFCCYITTGVCSGATILNIYDYLGGHAELFTQSNYDYKLCCVGTGISNSCSATYHATVLRLSDTTNAHVEENTQSNSVYDSNKACISSASNIACSYSDSCPIGTVCLSSISDATNAHIGGCSVYTTKICCGALPDISACTVSVVSDNSVTVKDTDIQLCSGADITNSSDPCYSVCWKGSGAPVVGSSDWKCSVCHDYDNNPVSCTTPGITAFSWSMPSGYVSPTNYTLVSGTLTSANPVVNFVDQDSNRQVTLNITNYAESCSGQNVKVLPTWKEISPF
jgi:hypothetical protein